MIGDRVMPRLSLPLKRMKSSDRYACIATSEVLNGLRDNGFHPFMVCQTRVRNTDKREHTKHMIRLRHAGQINGTEAKKSSCQLS